MIGYLIKSAGCLLLWLALYRLLLEREKMFRFNRAWLLAGLLFSFIVPVIYIGQSVPIPVIAARLLPSALAPATNAGAAPPASGAFPLATMAWTVYGGVAMVLAARFARNLWRMRACTAAHRQLPLAKGVRLVQVPGLAHSFTFYKAVFVNEEAWREQRIPPEVIAHELAHARQLHTIDVVLVELLRVLFWFNPLLLLYRRAIQCNHEFLADEAVTNGHADPKQYQAIVLDNVMSVRALPLGSAFHYTGTKKRLMMITAIASKKRIRAKQWAMMAVLPAAFVMFSARSIAQQPDGGDAPFPERTIRGTETLGAHPFVLIDGKQYPPDILTGVNPGCIGSSAIYTGDLAVKKYGPQAVDGYVELTTGPQGLLYLTPLEKENLAKERAAWKGFYHRITLKKADGSDFDKLFVNLPKSSMTALGDKDCKVGFLVGNTFFDERQSAEAARALAAASLPRKQSGLAKGSDFSREGWDLSGYKVVFYFR